ncbi:DNA-binding beta-propeller fold protein YncE [Arthrobacter stackebrandtii]|uniref:DNA-binding beta-propeller fold protein YncE n=1 Tax=Arthrobacter stackebrandtii TaxID=272161 RepID=A0ABS4YZ96_9MICC|nr:hypothetical protein [Arthrobacter stackebrandtii]MBP2413772.1 DNA-binding beta-propeller fold protein YncE [Arthrobacter stackebrandtii]PYH00360.1 hypothetical protein CVV67_09585 [Arthrobacter stackebrandtii]
MAKVLLSAAVVGTLSISGVTTAAAGPMAGTIAAALAEEAPEIAVGPQAAVMVTSPDGSRAYVAQGEGISAYDLQTGNAVATVTIAGLVTALTASRDGSMIFASSLADGGNTIVSISTDTNTVSSTTTIADATYSLAESSDGKSVLALGESSPKKLYVIDGASWTVTKDFPMPSDLEAMAVHTSPTDSHAYVARSSLVSPSTSESDVLVIDPGTGTLVTLRVRLGRYHGERASPFDRVGREPGNQ